MSKDDQPVPIPEVIKCPKCDGSGLKEIRRRDEWYDGFSVISGPYYTHIVDCDLCEGVGLVETDM